MKREQRKLKKKREREKKAVKNEGKERKNIKEV